MTFSRLPRLFRMKMACRWLFLALLLSLTAFGQDAAMFRGNLAHTGVYNAAGVPKFSQIKWKFHTDGQVISSPAVANGMAYVGSTDGNLYAVDLDIRHAKMEAVYRSAGDVVARGGERSRLFRKL